MAMGKFNITTTTQGRSIFSLKRPKERQQLTIDKDIMVLILKSQTYPIGLLL
jgi:hypothetical protein